MPGATVHTPLIIIRLLLESMRSQAVSTLLMRSPDRPNMPVAARRMFFCTANAASRAAALALGWSAAVAGVPAAAREGMRVTMCGRS
jgi:hypothetical protein